MGGNDTALPDEFIREEKGMDTYLAIDVGGTFTKYAIMDENGTILKKSKVPTEKESQTAFVAMLEEIYRKYGENAQGIAISSAGMIDSERGYMYNAGSIFCVHNLDLAGELKRRTGVPVSVENDARSAALAELWKGSLAGCKNAIALVLGTAVGGAVIVNGHILHGKHQMAGEFSYTLTEASDPLNPMKTLAMSGGVPSLIRICSKEADIPEEDLNGEVIFEKANAGNELYLNGVRKYARILAVQILNLHFAFDPERIAIGGGVSAQPLLISMIREEIKKVSQVYPYEVPLPEITACRFFNDSNLIGALYVLLKKIDDRKRKSA